MNEAPYQTQSKLDSFTMPSPEQIEELQDLLAQERDLRFQLFDAENARKRKAQEVFGVVGAVLTSTQLDSVLRKLS